MSILPRRMTAFGRLLILAICAMVLAAPFAIAQVTTGTITGVVTTKQDGSALPGVTVEAVHVPTGTRYSTVTESNGRFTIANAKIGGPYTITTSLEGFKASTTNNVQVRVGESSEVPIVMELAAVTEAITVTATVDPVINPGHTGATSSVTTKEIETLPTVNRQIQDFARTNPYFRVRADDPSATDISVAGRNNRYNNIQIDGAVNNDLFGLAATGTPGGQANTQPISIDAIQQIQLVVSPYDIRQGGFTGGGVNVVTRSGTNAFSGSIYGTKRDESFVGKNVPGFPRGTGSVEKPITNFNYDQYGFRLGGPIMRDRLFFFANAERQRQTQPQGVSADGSTATTYANATQDAFCGAVPGCSAAQLRQDLITRYSFDPGALGDVPLSTPSDLGFLRFDFNATSSNALTLRHNYVKGSTDIFSSNAARTASRFSYPGTIYAQSNKTNSTVAQLNTVISANMFNEGRFGYQTVRDARQPGAAFPSIEIGGSNQNATLNAGTERFSAANSLDQNITELTDDLTWVKGNHTLVFGTHNELFDFKNLFLSEAFGYYFYPTLGAFENQDCSVGCEYRISYATGSDPLRATSFGAKQYGLYGSDQWHLNNDVTLTFGLRVDKPKFDDTPSFNQIVFDNLGLSTAQHPSESAIISPRFGFNWNMRGDQQLRGGIGIFAGRTPYVWISNAYAGTGVEQVSLACRTVDKCTVPAFTPDITNQPKLGAAGALSVDTVDPDFKFPKVLRTTLGYDRNLFWGIRGTAEVLYSKTQQDVYYQNLNYVQTGTSPLDGRPTYARKTTKIVDATFLTNTDKGSDTTETIQFMRPFMHGLTLSAAYAHQKAESAFDATSSRAISNWRFQHSQGDIFTPTLGTSAFEQRNRFNISAAYSFNTGMFGHNLGLYYNAQSGRPYSLIMGGDPNKDTNSSNDLLYIPGSGNFILCPSNAGAPTSSNPCGTRTALDSGIFDAFIKGAGLDPSKARILNKYESYEPWSRHLDFHYGLGLPIKAVTTEVTFDVLNLLNLFDKNAGNVYFVSNQNYTATVTYVGQDPTTNKPIYRENSTTFTNGVRTSGSLDPGRQFSIADLQSRWQMRVGLRLSF